VKHEAFLQRSLQTFVRALGRALESEELSQVDGLLQRLDPRVKVIGLPALILAAAVSHRLAMVAAIFLFSVLLAMLSQIPLSTLATRIWLAALLFTGVIAFPAIFTTPGQAIYRLPVLGWAVTLQGCRSALFLIGRTETAATLSLLLVLSTPWSHILKALRSLRIPTVLVVIFSMTYRYIFLLLATARDLFEARQSRAVGNLTGRERRRMAASTAGALMGKSYQLSQEVYLAMQSRGFTGEARVLSDFAMRRRDYAGLAFLLALSATALWWGR
jgi:cobalt ECF transporter T component CbiQ